MMVVIRCYLCEAKPAEAERYGGSGHADGEVCPLCLRPTCRHHLATVRWRWRDPDKTVASALICYDCKKRYKHRYWDTVNRDWIS